MAKDKALTLDIETPRSDPSKFTRLDGSALSKIAEKYPWPKRIQLRLPPPEGRSLARYPGFFVLYEEALQGGFRLPLHPFMYHFLCDMDICPAQLTPNSWRCIVAYLLSCKELKLVASYKAFKHMTSLISSSSSSSAKDELCTIKFRKAFKFLTATDHGESWDAKWFLVSFQSPEIYSQLYNGFTIQLDDDRDKMSVEIFESLSEDLVDLPNYKTVDQNILEEAGLSLPLSTEGRVEQVDLYEQFIPKRKRNSRSYVLI